MASVTEVFYPYNLKTNATCIWRMEWKIVNKIVRERKDVGGKSLKIEKAQ